MSEVNKCLSLKQMEDIVFHISSDASPKKIAQAIHSALPPDQGELIMELVGICTRISEISQPTSGGPWTRDINRYAQQAIAKAKDAGYTC